MVKGFWTYTEPETMHGERWQSIKDFANYMVSNYGRVKTCERVSLSKNLQTYRIRSGQIIKQRQMRKGYLVVDLHKDCQRKTVFVHRLVAEAFVSGNAPGLVVNHLNEIKTDNRALNLEWCTPKENSNYGTARQRLSEAMTNNPKRSKPVDAFSGDTGRWIATFPSQRETARQLHCHLSTVQSAINRQKRVCKGLILISQ